MSDTIDAATAGPSTTAPALAQNQPEPAASSVNRWAARDLVRLVQGFYFIFWGLLLTALIGAQMFVQVWLHSVAAELLLAVGVVATLVGTWRLYQVRLTFTDLTAVAPLWRSRVRRLLVVAMLMSYFCGLFYMWRRVPGNLYLTGNAVAFIGAAIIYMILFNYTVAALGPALGRNDLTLESRLFGTCSVGLLLVPYSGTVLYVFPVALANKTNPVTEFQVLLTNVNPYLLVMLLLPISLTLSLAWTAKDVAMNLLTGLDQQR